LPLLGVIVFSILFLGVWQKRKVVIAAD